ncbi:3-hydroxyisobutyrate dehydrogenase [Polycladidibacter hongkongensis]|uniref:3-hydroxyisobutyrate dehydrogenase n=1 Tax=Polycladidibacter hongkongensis TaxID=1647556 RepID=UPI000834CB5E|nr:3-hydroxyisobutyrate dehydrogenase [Pseudovibrio hongkongensis]
MNETALRIGFIGLGNMGGPMAANLVAAGHEVCGFDLSIRASDALVLAGGTAATSLAHAVENADVVISMLPAGQHVVAVYSGPDGVLRHAKEGALFIDCSTIDLENARSASAAAAAKGFEMLDAPVSGGIAGAAAGTLTFMVGGSVSGFARAEPLLAIMGQKSVYAGESGAGQAAKICNNMLLGISMIGTCEAFVLAERMGLEPQKLFDIASTSSGQCWSLTSYCPVPGPVESSPANRDYQPGFAAELMLKDLGLSQEAAKLFGTHTPLGQHAAQLYKDYCEHGGRGLDFSGIIKFLREKV